MKLADFRPSRRNAIQFFEYMVGGGVYFWSGYATFAILYSGFGWAWFPAKVVDDIVGSALSYLVYRYWAFNSRRLTGHDSAVIKKYGLITVVTYVIDYLIIWGLNRMGVSPYIGFFISAGFFTVWNYLWYRFWVFEDSDYSGKHTAQRPKPRFFKTHQDDSLTDRRGAPKARGPASTEAAR